MYVCVGKGKTGGSENIIDSKICVVQIGCISDICKADNFQQKCTCITWLPQSYKVTTLYVLVK